MKKNIITFLFATCLLVGCSSNPGSNPPDPDIKSVTLLTDPNKTEYTVGEYFAPSGLSMTVINKSDVSTTVTYVGNESFFTFEPSLTTPLTADMTEVKATYEGFDVSIAIEVNEEVDSFTVDFTTTRTKVGNVSTTGDTSYDNFLETLQTYYFNSSDISLTALSGEYFQIKPDEKKVYVTETRYFDQLIYLSSRNKTCDVTLTFSKQIKSIIFNCEPFSKYIPYNSTQNVDFDTYLKVNNVKEDIAAHTMGDVNEARDIKFTVNNDTVHIEVPNEHLTETKNNRIIVYKITLEY